MKCQFIPIENKYKCNTCGFTTTVVNLQRNCRVKNSHNIALQSPPLMQRMENFGKAATQHALNGSPEASQEQINDRLAICKECTLFKMYTEEPITGLCTHTSCGCNISDQQRYMNKLAWADQTCPLVNEEFPHGKWVDCDNKYKSNTQTT